MRATTKESPIFSLERRSIFYFLLIYAFVVGCSGMNLFGNNSGIVYVLYGSVIPHDQVPVDNVNAFLLQEGYTASVLETYYRKNHQTIQKIYLGVDVDPSPLLYGIRAIPGVLQAEIDMDTKGLSTHPEAAYFIELDID